MHLFLLFPSCCFVVFMFRSALYEMLDDGPLEPIHISSSFLTSGRVSCYGLFDLTRSVFSDSNSLLESV